MKIAIVGAGLTGLTTAYCLSQKNHRVTIFEKEPYVGGLAAGFKKEEWDWSLDNFYHHLFTSDKAAKKLLSELNLLGRLFYFRPKTSLFYRGASLQFDSPLSILRFPAFSLFEKLQTGAVSAYLKATHNWKKLEKTTATSWLKKYYGQKAYQILWDPLMRAKFGRERDIISMSWFWARIKKRSTKLGYLEGGFQTLADRLADEIRKNQGIIQLKKEVKVLNDIRGCFDRIIVTTPASVFIKIAPNLPAAYKRKLSDLKMIGAISLILVLKRQFLKDNTYWLNINEVNFPFVALVEHTNFVNPQHYHHQHLIYAGGYYPQNHRYFKMTKKTILKNFLPYLKKINPQFKESFVIDYRLSKNLYAQPIVVTNYSNLIPPFKTPLPGVFLANMQMVYPWDRGINYMIQLGKTVAKAVNTA